MSEAKQMLFARNLMSVCVNGNDNAEYQGEIWTQYQDEPIAFMSVTDMLTKMDEQMDEWDFPQKALEQRHFMKNNHSEKNNENDSDTLIIDRIQGKNGTRNVQNKKGALGTFVVHVAFRQKATWQGEVIHTESNEKLSFSSAMELVKIIGNCIK